jgi:uncharacterized protein (DUF111 family)
MHLILRVPSGVSGDMLVAGFAVLAGFDAERLKELVRQIGIGTLKNSLTIKETVVDGISGWRAFVKTPKERSHRRLQDVLGILDRSALSPRAREFARETFVRLAEAEAAVHSKRPEEVTFHEIGALDSILDVCAASGIFDAINPERFISSPLPLCDGKVKTAHGILPVPAPAVLHLLRGIPVYGIHSEGETVTPTAVALLKTLGAEFSEWPKVKLEKTVRVFGSRKLPNIPNGALFALGTAA